MTGIVPKSKAKGVDFCGGQDNHFIIRADLGCYMLSNDFHLGKGLQIYSIHSNCQGGDHYFSDKTYWYIIKGKKYRRLTDMVNDDGEVFDLHPNCQGGDHYLSAFGWFYIIFQSRGKYRNTSSLTEDTDGTEHDLHPNCRNGLYYWGTSYYIYYMIEDEWGVHYHQNTDLSTNAYASTTSFHHDVMSFLPGGLAVTHGPSFGKWDLIKTISNDSNTSVTWEMKIIWKVGYTKSKSSSIEHNWNISVTGSCESGDLTSRIAKFQFSLSTDYGGAGVNTESENWEETFEKEDTVSLTLEPNKKMFVWQYKLGLGKEDFLFCRDIRLRSDSTPPTDVPLPALNE